jgi:hypothetical protein
MQWWHNCARAGNLARMEREPGPVRKVLFVIVLVIALVAAALIFHGYTHASCNADDSGNVGFNKDNGSSCVCSWWACHDVTTP